MTGGADVVAVAEGVGLAVAGLEAGLDVGGADEGGPAASVAGGV